ncbi:hypothetical protein RIF29_25327 [Crotalaria pallida]|uniref:Uncharacterized protein n=1 Tax=Crotalaria pallida TaxID=3830 RepID=A0AAN9EM86_CROPI
MLSHRIERCTQTAAQTNGKRSSKYRAVTSIGGQGESHLWIRVIRRTLGLRRDDKKDWLPQCPSLLVGSHARCSSSMVQSGGERMGQSHYCPYGWKLPTRKRESCLVAPIVGIPHSFVEPMKA